MSKSAQAIEVGDHLRDLRRILDDERLLDAAVARLRNGVAARQVVVVDAGRNDGGGDRAIDPRRHSALEFDGVGEDGAEAALDDGLHLVGQSAVEGERDEDLAILHERPHAQRFALRWAWPAVAVTAIKANARKTDLKYRRASAILKSSTGDFSTGNGPK